MIHTAIQTTTAEMLVNKADVPTVEELSALFVYDPDSGVLNRTRRVGKYAVGTVAGSVAKNGYVYVCIPGGRKLLAHRVIWAMVTGAWPLHQVDHIDGHRTNNRIGNLRDVPHSMNNENNRHALPSSKTGLLGASPNCDKFRAQISVRGKARYIGLFASSEAAHAAYLAAKRSLHAGCTI